MRETQPVQAARVAQPFQEEVRQAGVEQGLVDRAPGEGSLCDVADEGRRQVRGQ
ncbi:hypothetical protein [Streptomyces aureus]|uniref:hypothetical protein n=1 Tax=Streptomyces aureus TaxID=193461 RepID=UPI00363BE573